MTREYATQMEAARKGIVTKEMEIVAKKERMTTEELLPLVASGKVAICANKNHKCIDPEGVGSMLKTKINVNLGVSRDCKDYDVEMKKVMAAVDMGAHAIMDLSSHGNTIPFRRKLTSECPAMIGTVPVYDSVIHYGFRILYGYVTLASSVHTHFGQSEFPDITRYGCLCYDITAVNQAVRQLFLCAYLKFLY